MNKFLSALLRGSFLICCSLITNSPIQAQSVSTDNTMPEPTQVTPTDAGVEINGGTTRGGNLFHSFQDFSIPAGSEASFNNNTDVVNILNRVTGGNISNIDGLIRANGGANLFLINPAGIVFGNDARLDIGGSFFGSTADSLLFDDGTEFSATNAQAKPILTINAPVGLNLRDNPQPIANQSTANDLGLQVDLGKNITLVGGDINFEGGILTAPGGRVELGGLSTAGEIGISSEGNLTFSEGIAKANVNFTDGAVVNVAADGGGFININADNLSLTEESALLAGIAQGSTTPEALAGDITVDVNRAIALKDFSGIQNLVYPNSIGNAGSIKLESASLSLDGGSQISSVSLGQGNGGDIAIDTQDLSITGLGRVEGDNSPPPSIASVVASTTRGNAGNIAISAGSFSLTNFASIDASNLSTAGGNAGNVAISARDTVLISESGINSILFNQTGASGNAGDIKITANSIGIEQTSFIDSSNLSRGSSGNISLEANSILIDSPFIRSQIVDGEAGNINLLAKDSLQIDGTGAAEPQITVTSLGSANGGNINIEAQSFSLENGVSLNAVSNGEGNGGNIIINSNTTKIDQALVNASSFGKGKGGNIQIFATESVEIRGSGLADLLERIVVPAAQNPACFENFTASGVIAAGFRGIVAVTASSEGTAAGNIGIETAKLDIKEGGLIATATTGAGTAGNITINASDSLFVNEAIISSSTTNIGQAGDIKIDTAQFLVEDGGQIAASSLANGDGGNLTIDATESVELKGTAKNFPFSSSLLVGSQLSSGAGNGGDLILTTPELTISDGAEITASSLGTGNAGALTIFTELLVLKNNGNISTTAGSEEAGGNGGNIKINTNFLVAFPSGNNDITANAFQGEGGEIQISTEGIFGIAERDLNPNSNDINASSNLGLDGSIAIEIFNLKTFQETTATPKNIVESENQVIAGICDPIQTAQDILDDTKNRSSL